MGAVEVFNVYELHVAVFVGAIVMYVLNNSVSTRRLDTSRMKLMWSIVNVWTSITLSNENTRWNNYSNQTKFKELGRFLLELFTGEFHCFVLSKNTYTS